MSKFECTNKRCTYECKLEITGRREAPKKCQYTGMDQSWKEVEQFGNSEQLTDKQTMEKFMGFYVPKFEDFDKAVAEFNNGESAYGCLYCCCDDILCEDCIFCCNHGSKDAKLAAFAEYARSRGYDITRWEGVEGKEAPKGLTVRFKKLHPEAKAPYQATPGSAGFDLTAVSKEEDDYIIKYGTGLAVEIPEGHVGLVFPRSSIYKTGLLLTNSVGVIDSDYRGEISAVFTNIEFHKEYKVGDRIAQLVIMPIPAVKFEEAEELTETKRGAGGYGSTGR